MQPTTSSISSQPSDLKPLLSNLSSLKSTLSIDHSSVTGDGTASAAPESTAARWSWWWSRRRRRRRRRREASSVTSTPSSAPLFALGPCVAELRACVSLATPLCLQNILYLSNALVLIVVIGHSSSSKKDEGGGSGGGSGSGGSGSGSGSEQLLAAAVLGTSLFNVTGLSIAIGLATALETLCAQAYGARAYTLLGDILQRALAVQAAAVAVIGAGWWFLLDAALAALGQEPQLASAAASFVRECYSGLVLTAGAECVRRYLVAQGVVAVPAVAAAASAVSSAATAVALVPRRGLSGAAAAVNVSAAASLGALVAGAAWHHGRCRRCDAVLVAAGVDNDDVGGDVERRRNDNADADVERRRNDNADAVVDDEGNEKKKRQHHHLTWAGWSASTAFSGWGPYLRIAAPSASQTCLEWWTFECIILLAGLLKPGTEAAVAATGIGFQTVTICYSLPLGMAAASATRVGHELGAGNAKEAARAAAVSTVATFFLSASVASALFGARHLWARLFTSDPAVLDVARVVMPLTALAIVGDGVNGALGGCVRGAGRQAAAAALNVVFYWVLGVPTAALLAFKVGLGVRGLWIGLAATTVVQALAMSTFVATLDWRREAEEARRRVAAASHSNESSSNVDDDGDGGLIGTAVVAAAAAAAATAAPLSPPAPVASSSSSSQQQPPLPPSPPKSLQPSHQIPASPFRPE